MGESKRPSCQSSPAGARIGSQKPRLHTARGEVAYTDGADASALSSDLGLELFEWQRDILDLWCAKDALNKPAYITCGLDVPRQNGKNACLEAYEVLCLAVYGWHVLHTAHRVKTTKKAFYRLVKYFTDEKNHPELAVKVDTIRRTNGEEAITLDNGGSIEFASRTTGSARGYDDIQLVVYDEAQELTDSQYQSIDYAMSASTTDGGAKQKIFTGTPPYEGCNGTVFARQRSAALNVTPSRTTWSSWACEGLPRKDARFEDILDDIYTCNPSMGLLLDIEYTETEFAGSTVMGFAQERLDWWTPLKTQDLALPEGLWERTEIAEIADRYPGKAALAVKFARDGSAAYLAGCKQTADGAQAAVELIDVFDLAEGTQPIAEWLMARKAKYACVLIDGLNGADALVDRLADMAAPRGFTMRTKAADVIAAAVTALDGLSSGALVHTSCEALDMSAVRSIKRPIGKSGGWGFGPGEGADSYAIEAAALAYRALKMTKRDPSRKGKAA